MEERKYRIRQDWIFQLESMHDRLWNIIDDARDGKLSFPFMAAGRKMKDEDDLFVLMDECSDLEWAAKDRKVTSSEYGRIKEIANWRAMQRYTRCLAGGMDESEAAACLAEV